MIKLSILMCSNEDCKNVAGYLLYKKNIII